MRLYQLKKPEWVILPRLKTEACRQVCGKLLSQRRFSILRINRPARFTSECGVTLSTRERLLVSLRPAGTVHSSRCGNSRRSNRRNHDIERRKRAEKDGVESTEKEYKKTSPQSETVVKKKIDDEVSSRKLTGKGIAR